MISKGVQKRKALSDYLLVNIMVVKQFKPTTYHRKKALPILTASQQPEPPDLYNARSDSYTTR
jgi:hypothetical protein